MRRLVDAPEHLDGALADPDVLDGNLRDLRRINRQFGGIELSVRVMSALVASPAGSSTVAGGVAATPLQVLDVGAGACDIPLALASATGPWSSVRVTAVDSRREVLDAARRVTPGLEGRDDVTLALADGRALPYPDGAFDVAHASLVVHHLEEGEAVEFLRELGRVARTGIVINDLERGWLPWLGAWLVLHAMTRNAYTLHDGPLSVRRSYTAWEMRNLLGDAGLRPAAQASAFAGHRWAIAAVLR